MESTIDIDHWIYRKPAADQPELRLFCLPYAGGGAAVYRLWQDLMPAGVEVCRVQLPGRESRLRERPFDRIDALVSTLVDVIAPLLDRPYAIFGHSMGALVSFELARALRRARGTDAEHLFFSAWRAPQLPLGSALHELPEAEFIEKLQARFSGIPEGVLSEPELLEMMLPILRADLAICETYRYAHDAPFDTPITIFGGHEDHWINAMELSAWSEQTSRQIDVKSLPGDHFFINHADQMVPKTVASTLTDVLTRPGRA